MEFPEGFENLIKEPRSFTRDLKFPAADKIRILDTTLRDGEQCPGVAFTPNQKLEIAKSLSAIGVHIIDLGFPGGSKSDEDAFDLILDARRNGEISETTELLLTSRANRNDIDHILRVLLEKGLNPSEVTFFVFTSGSDLHVKYKLGKTLLKREGKSENTLLDTPIEFFRDANIRMMTEIIELLKERGVESIEAGCGEDGSRADIDYIIELAQSAIKAGATRIAFADTIGVMTPQSVEFYFSRLRKAIGDIPLVTHCHDDFNLATINTITALGNGADIATCTVNGIGERAGNAALHSVVGALYALYNILIPRFDYERLNELSRLVENYSGIPLKVNEPIVGHNVYTHESGIHSAGMVIDSRIYGHVAPQLYGGKSRFIFGKHSGRNAVKHVLSQNSDILKNEEIMLDDDLVDRVLKQVKETREKNQREKSSERIIQRYYQVMDKLGINEDELIKIAVLVGRERGW